VTVGETGAEPAAGAPSTVPNLPSAVVVTNPSARPGDFTIAQLQAALLTTADLAPGWTVGTSEINVTGPPASGCPALDRVNGWPASKVVVGFIAGDGTQLIEGLSSMPEADARELMRTMRSVIGECLTITIRDNLGDPQVLQLSEPRVAASGDETYALRMTAEGLFSTDTVMTRRGGLLVTTGSISREPGSPLLATISRQALARVGSALK
jgi:hypothetical protein